MIRVEDISLGFNGRTLFQSLAFEVQPGEKLCITGPSGSGKSSLLELIMGFRQPDNGRIFFDNHEVSSANIRKQRTQMAWLPQNVNILGSINIGFTISEIFNYSNNLKFKPDDKEIENNLNMLGLDKDILNQAFDTISGGEKQRIGLMIAKLLGRKLLLLDEPTSALDQDLIGQAIEYINPDKSTTVISVSHDHRWIQSSDKIIEL